MLQIEVGYLLRDPTQTHKNTHTFCPGSSGPELWTADRTFHSLQSYVSFPASSWVSLSLSLCVLYLCEYKEGILLNLIVLIFLLLLPSTPFFYMLSNSSSGDRDTHFKC